MKTKTRAEIASKSVSPRASGEGVGGVPGSHIIDSLASGGLATDALANGNLAAVCMTASGLTDLSEVRADTGLPTPPSNLQAQPNLQVQPNWVARNDGDARIDGEVGVEVASQVASQITAQVDSKAYTEADSSEPPIGTLPESLPGEKSANLVRMSSKHGEHPGWQVVMIPVAQIAPNPFQPRVEFSEAEMEELTASVREHGVLQPVMVRSLAVHPLPAHQLPVAEKDSPHPKSWQYHLVAGERRLRASRMAKRKFIPAIVRDDLSDLQVAELAVVENVQRANLSAIEEARGYKRLMIEFRLKEERIARKVGKSVQTIRETLKLLGLPQLVQLLISGKKLTASHGHVLLKLAPFEQICNLVASKAVAQTMTATALGENLLPNARDLKAKSLVIELDYKTKFDWKSECRECPHKAYVTAGYSSYCLKPLEWQRKQNEAVERAKIEAAQVLEAARQQGGASGTIDTTQLPNHAYRDLSYLSPDRLPAGCSGACPCRSQTCDPSDPTKTRPICLNPPHFEELQNAERAAHEEARARKFTGLWQQSREALAAQRASGDFNLGASIALWPLFAGAHLRYGNAQTWHGLCQRVAQELSLELPWEVLQGTETTPNQGLTVLSEFTALDLIEFMACLHLAQEAQTAIRFGGETPLLSFMLGHDEGEQGVLGENEDENEDQEDEEEDENGNQDGEWIENAYEYEVDAVESSDCEGDNCEEEGD